MIPPSLLTEFEEHDCHYYFYPGYSDHRNSLKCDELWEKINNLGADLNWYDLYRPVYPAAVLDKQKALKANRHGSVMIDGQLKTYKKGYTQAEYTPFARVLQASNDPIILGDYMTTYMNRKDVREAFHIPSEVPAWEMCSETLEYHE